MNIKLLAAVVGLSLAPAAVNAASTPLVFPPQADTWQLYAPDDGTATMKPVTPTDNTATNLLYPTNDPNSWAHWFLDDKSSSLTADGDAIKVVVGKVNQDAWRTALVQRDLPLTEGGFYTIKFRAKASAARPIFVMMQIAGGDWHSVGIAQAVPITTEWQSFSLPVAVSGITADGVQFVFQVGQQTGTVWLADVSLTPANGAAQLPMPASALQINVLKASDPDWRTHLASKPFNLTEGKKYTVSYAIESEKPRTMGALAQVGEGDYHAVGKADFRVYTGPSWRVHTVTFTATNIVPKNNILVYILGGTTGTVTIGDVKVTEVP